MSNTEHLSINTNNIYVFIYLQLQVFKKYGCIMYINETDALNIAQIYLTKYFYF